MFHISFRLPANDTKNEWQLSATTPMRFRLKTHAFFFIRFRLPSTQIRSKTAVYVCENGGFRKRYLEERFLKTEV